MMHGGFGFGSFGTFGWIGLILNLVITVGVILGIILLIVWLVRNVSSGKSWTTNLNSQAEDTLQPQEILKARYARGEINREEYQQMLADMS